MPANPTMTLGTQPPKRFRVAFSFAGERLMKDFPGAEKDYTMSLEIAATADFAEGVACFTGDLSELAIDRGNWAEAERRAREALDLSTGVGRQELIGANCHRLATALPPPGKHAGRAAPLLTRGGHLLASGFSKARRSPSNSCGVRGGRRGKLTITGIRGLGEHAYGVKETESHARPRSVHHGPGKCRLQFRAR